MFRARRRAGCNVIGKFWEKEEGHANKTKLACQRFCSLPWCAFGASAREMAKETILLEEIHQLRAVVKQALQTERNPAGDSGTVTNSAVLSISTDNTANSIIEGKQCNQRRHNR